MQDGEKNEADNPALACTENPAENPVDLAYGGIGNSLLHKVPNHEQGNERHEEPDADAQEFNGKPGYLEVCRERVGEEVGCKICTRERCGPGDKPEQVLQEPAPHTDEREDKYADKAEYVYPVHWFPLEVR